MAAVMRKVGYVLACCVVLTFCLVAGLQMLLPLLLDRYIRHAGEGDGSLPPFSCQVRRVGFTGADIADIRIGSAGAEGIGIASLHLDYHPLGLIQQRIGRIVIAGLTLPCDLGPSGIRIGGHDPSAVGGRSAGGAPEGRDSADPLPHFFHHIRIRESSLHLRVADRLFRIPFQADIDTRPLQDGRIHLDLSIGILNGDARLQAWVDPKAMEVVAGLEVAGLEPACLVSLLGAAGRNATVKGTVSGHADARLHLNPIHLVSSEMHLTGSGLRGEMGGVRWQALTSAADTRGPLHDAVTVRQTGDWQWRISGGGLRVTEPLPVTATLMEATVDAGEPVKALSARIAFTVGSSGAPAGPAEPEKPEKMNQPAVHLTTRVTGKHTGEGWHAVIEPVRADPPPSGSGHTPSPKDSLNIPVRWRFGEGRSASATIQAAHIQLSGMHGRINGKVTGRLADLEGAADGLSIQADRLAAEINAVAREGETAATFRLALTRISGKGRGADGSAAALEVKGEGTLGGEQRLQVNGEAALSNGQLRAAEGRLRAEGITCRIPLTRPRKTAGTAAPAEEGTLSVSAIRYGRYNAGKLTAAIRTGGERFRLEGVMRSPLLDNLDIGFQGGVGWGSRPVQAAFTVHGAHRFSRAFDLGAILPAFKGARVEGTLNLDGRMALEQGVPVMDADLRVENGGFRMPEKDLALTGIETRLHLPALAPLRSDPSQMLRIRDVKVGGLRMQDLGISYRLETDGGVFVEKGRFRWCGGSVTLQSLPIRPGGSEYDLILYCDRLHLATLLDQLGVASAEGEGTVSGRIPLHLKQGRMVFDDGFLYSSPGTGGVIHVTGAELITGALPPGSMQHTQIDLAREALKNYLYDWVRLRMNTEGENLLVELQFDGKPADPLPFEYRKEIGGFVRVDAKSPGSRFQGIRLDVNMGLPLNRILRYRELLKWMQP